jgi:hypothetical protein
VTARSSRPDFPDSDDKPCGGWDLAVRVQSKPWTYLIQPRLTVISRIWPPEEREAT